MAESIIFQQWRDQHHNNKSPFADTARVPDGLADVFVDASLFPFAMDGTLWLSSITITDTTATVSVTDGKRVVSGSVPFGSSEDKISLYTPAGQSAGVLVGYTAGFAALFAMQRGDTTYTKAQTEFAAGCIMPLPNTGVLSVNAGGDYLVGEPVIVGEHGVRVHWNGQAVQVDVNGVVPARAKVTGLRTISHIKPNSSGAFNFVRSRELASDAILRITGKTNGLHFSLIGKPNAAD